MDTHELPFQYCPDVQSVEEVATHALPFQYWPDPQEVELEEVTQEEPFQYWLEEHADVLVMHALPFQYWPELQEGGYVELAMQAVPFQYCPDVQEDAAVLVEDPPPTAMLAAFESGEQDVLVQAWTMYSYIPAAGATTV